MKYSTFVISNFCHVLNVVCFLLGNSSASEFYMPFQNTVCSIFYLQSRWNRQCSETSAYKIQMLRNYPEESIQQYSTYLYLILKHHPHAYITSYEQLTHNTIQYNTHKTNLGQTHLLHSPTCYGPQGWPRQKIIISMETAEVITWLYPYVSWLVTNHVSNFLTSTYLPRMGLFLFE
jgi:hypothetical protein